MKPVDEAGMLVAFLRGMNLGGRRLTNDELVGHFAAAGLEGATAYQASGNVVFEDPGTPLPELESRIELHLEDALGYEVATFVRSMDELEAIAALDTAAAEADGFKVHVLFLGGPPPHGLAGKLETLETPDDRLRLREREVLWLRRGRLKESTLPLEDTAVLTGGVAHTMRTLGTVRRIVKKFA